MKESKENIWWFILGIEPEPVEQRQCFKMINNSMRFVC